MLRRMIRRRKGSPVPPAMSRHAGRHAACASRNGPLFLRGIRAESRNRTLFRARGGSASPSRGDRTGGTPLRGQPRPHNLRRSIPDAPRRSSPRSEFSKAPQSGGECGSPRNLALRPSSRGAAQGTAARATRHGLTSRNKHAVPPASRVLTVRRRSRDRSAAIIRLLSEVLIYYLAAPAVWADRFLSQIPCPEIAHAASPANQRGKVPGQTGRLPG